MKLGKSEIFKDNLTNMKIYSRSNKKHNNENIKFSNDIYPKFKKNSLSNSKYNILLNKIQKNKQKLNQLLNNFSGYNDNFEERIRELNNDLNKQRNKLLNKNKQEFQSFQNLIAILIALEDERNVNELKQISEYEYLNLQNSNYQKILHYINISKNQIILNLACDNISEKEMDKNKRYSSVNKYNRNVKNEKNEYKVYNPLNNNVNFYNYNKREKRNKSNKNNKLKNNLNYPLKEKEYYEMNKLNIFRLMIDDQLILDKEISNYLNEECKNVDDAVNKYYQNLYGTENLTLTFSYPELNNLSVVYNFNFISDISDLFKKAIIHYPFTSNVHLFTNNKEILIDNKNKIKCIGSLKLENNSVIFVYN